MHLPLSYLRPEYRRGPHSHRESRSSLTEEVLDKFGPAGDPTYHAGLKTMEHEYYCAFRVTHHSCSR